MLYVVAQDKLMSKVMNDDHRIIYEVDDPDFAKNIIEVIENLYFIGVYTYDIRPQYVNMGIKFRTYDSEGLILKNLHNLYKLVALPIKMVAYDQHAKEIDYREMVGNRDLFVASQDERFKPIYVLSPDYHSVCRVYQQIHPCSSVITVERLTHLQEHIE